MTQIATVYAEALYSLAKEENNTQCLLQQLTVLEKALAAEPDFVRLLSAHNLTKEERCGILDSSFREKVHPYVLNFMKILTEKGYMRHLVDCCKAYRGCYNRDHGILEVRAVTAVALTPEQSQRLSQKLAKVTGKQIDLQPVVDSSVVGGVRLDYDGKRLEDTVAHRLESIGKLLKNTVL